MGIYKLISKSKAQDKVDNTKGKIIFSRVDLDTTNSDGPIEVSKYEAKLIIREAETISISDDGLIMNLSCYSTEQNIFDVKRTGYVNSLLMCSDNIA